jgi:hypothetical protein
LDELKTALQNFAAENDHEITQEDKDWIHNAVGQADADGSESLDLEEFAHFAHAFHDQFLNGDGEGPREDDQQPEIEDVFN